MSVQTKFFLVDFDAAQSPTTHPEIRPFLDHGWTIQSVAHRIVEPRVPKLLVKLVSPAPSTLAA